MKKKVLVAMSGGVDSSVAAALLKEQGYDVTGVTMRFDLPDIRSNRPRCCSTQGIADARRVADILGIAHLVVELSKEMQEYVIADFLKQYSLGFTPNPCVRCNELIKFDALLKKALELKMDYLATGHYARIVRKGRGYALKKASDERKDQSYFLYRLAKKNFKRILFPLGGLAKTEVRELARKFKLPVAEKKESQEICFIPSTYQEFAAAHLKGSFKPGQIVDTQGKVLGEHKGIPFYTIGQRDKLGISCGFPVHVKAIDRPANRIVVGKKEELFESRMMVSDVVYAGPALRKKTLLSVRIRHLSPESAAYVTPRGKSAKVVFQEPRFAITPGQSAVFYNKDTVVGGGIIC